MQIEGHWKTNHTPISPRNFAVFQSHTSELKLKNICADSRQMGKLKSQPDSISWMILESELNRTILGRIYHCDELRICS